MIVPAALALMLPHGFVGLFCAIMLAALISSNNAFMHAWGSVLLQDIVLPFRKGHLSTKDHIWALRGSILAVALIAFVLSLSIKPGQSILMYFALFNSVWLGPAGAVILGGLYWKRGTTRAALLTFIFGTALSIGFIICTQGWQSWTGHPFPINGQWSYLLNIGVSAGIYAAVSIWDDQPAHDMDMLLHRGKHAIAGEHPFARRRVAAWQRIFGIDGQFTREDRVTAYLVFGYFLLSLLVFSAGMIYASIVHPGDDAWAKFWHLFLGAQLILLFCGTLCLGAGGIRDMLRLFRSLSSSDRDFSDDGTVPAEVNEQIGVS